MNNGVRKNLVPGADRYWDARLSLREMDQKFKRVGTIGYWDSKMTFLNHHSKIFRLHAELHNAAGAVRVPRGEGPEYCYMVARGSISCLLVYVTVLLFCFNVKLFLIPITNYVEV